MSTAPDLQRAITHAVVGLWSRKFGRGPELARTYLNDDNVVVVMHGGLLPHEQTMLDAGDRDAVRTLRLRFERAVRPEMKRVVEEVTGREVLAFDSNILFEPTRSFELFVLREPLDEA